MAVLVADPSIRSMYDQLGSVVLGDLATDIDGRFLGGYDNGGTLTTFTLYSPVVPVWYYMLVLLTHLRSMFSFANLSRSGRGFRTDRHLVCVDRRSSVIDRRG